MKYLILLLFLPLNVYCFGSPSTKELTFQNLKFVLPQASEVAPLPSLNGYFIQNKEFTATLNFKQTPFKNFNKELAEKIWKRNLDLFPAVGINEGCKAVSSVWICKMKKEKHVSALYFTPYKIISLIQNFNESVPAKTEGLEIAVIK